MAVSSPAPPPQWCDECRVWLPFLCIECGQPSHLICGGNLYFVPVDHSDCGEGLGWTPQRHVCSDEDAA